MSSSKLALGIDFGTSGARAIAINPTGEIVDSARQPFLAGEVSSPNAWQRLLWQLLDSIALPVRDRLSKIAINATSATVLLCDRTSQPLTPALLYNDTTARSLLSTVQAIAPSGSPTCSATSSLVKALWWQKTLSPEVLEQVAVLCHQADWLAGLLHAQPPVSDYHNVLKLGYDVRQLCYPDWLLALPIAAWLPEVKVPGAVIAAISPDIARRFAIPTTCQICAGTTDSIAAFLASGAVQAGDAVTSLGSTLVLKLLSKTRIDDQAYGVYSHRLGDLWLVGGASNTGGAVLKTYFSSDKIAQLSAQIDLSLPCNLHYYPLNSPGERFPVNDPDRLPQLTPRPESDVEFLYGMLDAIARIEAEGYQKLQSLGAPALRRLYTAGGGAKNEKWQQLRARHLYHLRGEVAVMRAESTEAAYGTAKLAMNGLN